MDCSEVRARLVEAAFGLVEDPALRAHVEDCAICRPLHEKLSGRRRALRSWGEREPSPELNERVLGRVRAGGRRRLLLGIAAGLLLGVTAGLVGIRRPASDRVEGSFEVLQGAAWTAVRGVRPAVPGLEIRAVGGGAWVSLGGRADVEVQAETRIAIRSMDPSGGIIVAQDSGEARYRVRPGSGPFEVQTPSASIQVQGTEFNVRITGEASMKKGTIVGTTLAAVVGVTSGLVTVRNSHGEVRAAPGSTATAPAASPPRLLADSEARVARLETERKSVAARAKEDLERLQELARREGELDRAAPAPKKAKNTDTLRAMMSVGLRGNAKQAALKTRKTLELTDEQTLQVEEVLMAFMTESLKGIMADTLSLQDLERLSDGTMDLERRLSKVLTESQMKKFREDPLSTDSLGFSTKGSGFEPLLESLDPETRAKVTKETNRFMSGWGVTMIRGTMLGAGKESEDLMERFSARYVDRLKEILPPDKVAPLAEMTRKLNEGARKQMERLNEKK